MDILLVFIWHDKTVINIGKDSFFTSFQINFVHFCLAGRFTPGSFTNPIQAAFKEPRLIVVTNPNFDHQAVTEASFVNIPVIAFCDVSTSLRCIDIAIPSNNRVEFKLNFGQYSSNVLFVFLFLG